MSRPAGWAERPGAVSTTTAVIHRFPHGKDIPDPNAAGSVPGADPDARSARSVLFFHVEAKVAGHREDILVSAATHVHAKDVIGRQVRGDLGHMGKRMGRFERRYDALLLA